VISDQFSVDDKMRLFLTFSLLAVLLAACSPATDAAPTLDPNAVMTQAFATLNAEMTATAQASAPTETPVPTATATRSGPPPELPTVFQTDGLLPGVTPKTYINDECQYLKSKWDPNNATPGTIVMVIFHHGVEKGIQTSPDPTRFGSGDYKQTMKSLHDFGFQAINIQQLTDFLYNNSKIPPRSVVLIKDDRKSGEDLNDWNRPYWEQWGWPVVNAWINMDDYRDPNWADNAAFEKEGMVDHQAHGVVHNINMDDSATDEFIRSELQGSIDGIQKYFGKKPLAIIWTGGGFGLRSVQIARELGYRLGFTVNPRGPIMFNWVPQADTPTTSTDIAEGPVGDPLMTLPRYWPSQVIQNLDTVRIMSNDAAAYAEQVKAVELEYYDIVCAPTLGPIPAVVP
jgi:hypothetical protein